MYTESIGVNGSATADDVSNEATTSAVDTKQTR